MEAIPANLSFLSGQAQGSLTDLFEAREWPEGDTSWPEAGLAEAMFYLRRSKFVDLPPEVKRLIPKQP